MTADFNFQLNIITELGGHDGRRKKTVITQ
jgi:hypothetical protein